ncbi:MAG: hypothetical protein U0746_11690 [Gemmataceae bacterium]
MRRLIFAAVALAVGSLALFAADKDTSAATNTRTKLLKAKVTVDFKDEMLDECLKEISRQTDEAGLGKLGATYDIGVSKNQRLTFTAKDKPVEDVLDGMLKKNGLGYIVVSKDKDRYDGWLKVTRGDERGWPKGQEPKDAKTKGKDAKDAKAKEAKESKAAPSDADKAEKEAASKLDLAKSLLKDGKTDRAKTRFQEIVDKYPTTKAAEEAKKELEKLGK